MDTPKDPYEGLKKIIGDLDQQYDPKTDNITPDTTDTDTTEDISVVSENISQTEISSQNTAENLTEAISCPYPNHVGYTKLRNRLSSTQQEFLKKNVRITDDGKIEIIKMKRKYSLMLPNPSITEGVYDGSNTDRANKLGIVGVNYFDPVGAMRTVWRYGHDGISYIMQSKDEINQLLACLPGTNEDEKLLALSILLDIPKAGCLHFHNEWIHVGVTGYVRISKVFSEHPKHSFRLFFHDDHAGMDFTRDVYASPTLIYEHIVDSHQEDNDLNQHS